MVAREAWEDILVAEEEEEDILAVDKGWEEDKSNIVYSRQSSRSKFLI